jgi:2-polyprenyl-3-methyl-5-hydroxy-6-metoxy-1,4-benzoquinol methylase
MTLSVIVNVNSTLNGSQELEFGLRRLRSFCAAGDGFAQWDPFDFSDKWDHALAQIQALAGEKVLVIVNPALVTTSRFFFDLDYVLQRHPNRFVVAADPRAARGEWQIDYAGGSSFERYVARRAVLPLCAESELNAPWVFIAKKHLLVQLFEASEGMSWPDVFEAVRRDSIVAQHAFVHSFADYQMSDRREMIALIPNSTGRLMDVGGGEGWFLSAFQESREGLGLLVEPSASSAAAAQLRGLAVANVRFEEISVEESGRFDCISFLDVLEHLEDPLAALLHAKSLLNPNGTVLLSVPNVGHWSVIEDLLEGRFDYLPVGILCCTHLRFFTERSLRDLLTDAGLKVRAWNNQPSPLPARLTKGLDAARAAGMPVSFSSMETDSFHVLAEAI